MSNSTLQSPPKQRTTRRGSAGFRKQTAARFEGRRDGTPLIFGWGKHLTRAQKSQFQRLALYIFSGVVLLAIVAVGIFGWVQQNVLIPNSAIVTVNGKDISQDTYRRALAFTAQVQWNTLQQQFRELDSLKAIYAKDNGASQASKDASVKATILSQQIQTNETAFKQPQITQTAINYLIEDQLIQRAISENSTIAKAVALTPAEITTGVNDFKAAFPPGEKYSLFLSRNNLTENDVRNGVTIQLRRAKMQTFLASTLVSPTRQVHLRRIETNTVAAAQAARDQLVSGKATWDALAKQVSLDPNTKNIGGDMGWIAPGTGDAGIGIWAQSPQRTVNEISPVIRDSSGTYDVVQILAIDEKRPVDAAALTAAQNNALLHWLSGQRADLRNTFTVPSATMLTDKRNQPIMPDLNAQLPNVSGNPGASALPGGPIPQLPPNIVPTP